jgi:drug/metabolite transporter (DMT)-like permease
LIVNLLPFWILFLAHFFIPGDRITRRKFFGILLGFSGVAFMFAEKQGVTADFRTGDLIILSATIIWSCNVTYLKRIISAFSAFQITLYSMVFAVFSHYHLVLQHNLLETNHQRLQRISNNPVFNGFCSARLFAGSPFVGCAHDI